MLRVWAWVLTVIALGARAPVAEADELVVGEVGSLTGPEATFGISTHQGIQLAVEQLNAKGGLLGRRVRLRTVDDQGKPEEAVSAVTSLVTREGAVAILGEVASKISLQMAPKAQALGVPMISPSSTNVRVTQVGDLIFRVCFIDPFQGEVMARFSMESLKAGNVAVLRDVSSDYSMGLADAFVATLTRLGGRVVADESYRKGDVDFRAQLTRLKSLSPQAIFVPGYYSDVGLVARQAREMGIAAPLMGGDGWDSEKLYEIGGEAIEGGYFSNHYSVDDPSPRIRAFVDAYKARFGSVPDGLAAMGYDAMGVLAGAVVRAGDTSGSRLREALAATRDFDGVTGRISMDAHRDASKPAAVLKVEKGGRYAFVQRIEPAAAMAAAPAVDASTPIPVAAAATVAPAQPSRRYLSLQEGPDLVIGEVGSLTGPEATFGLSTHNGLLLAVEELNRRGGVGGRQLRLRTVDDQGKPEEAVNAVTSLITREKAVVIVGEVASKISLQMAPKAQALGVPMVSPSSTNVKVTQVGDLIFRVCFIDPFQGEVMARFARETLKAGDVAVLRDVASDYSVGLADAFVATFGRLGGRIVLDESYRKGDVDFRAQLTKIKQAAPAAVFLPGYYSDVGLIARQAREMGITAPLMGGDGWDSEKLHEIGGAAVEGGYFSAHYSVGDPSPRIRAFADAYKARFGALPDGLAAMGYDAMLVVADALSRAHSAEGPALREALATTRDFDGVTGRLSIDAARNAVKPAVVLRVAPGGAYEFVQRIEPSTASLATSAASPTPVATAEVRPPAAAPVSTPFSWAGLLQHLFTGLSVGAIYALIALGYTMVFGVLKLINFAHGDVVMVGAFVAYYAAKWTGVHGSWSFALVALVLAVLVAAALGWVIERAAYRPLRDQPRIASLITAIGISLLLENGGQLLFGAEPRRPLWTPALQPVSLGPVTVQPLELLTLALALLLMAALQYVVFRTRFGLAMRAVSHDARVARLMGVPVDRVISWTFMLGSALAATAGLLYSLTYPRIDPFMGLQPGMKAFIAAVLGGIGNVPGAMLGGLVLGLSEEFVAGYVSSSLRDAFAFTLLIGVLLFKPTGLLGSRSIEKV